MTDPYDPPATEEQAEERLQDPEPCATAGCGNYQEAATRSDRCYECVSERMGDSEEEEGA